MVMPRPGRISGRALRALVATVRSTPMAGPVTRQLRADLGIDGLARLGPEARGRLPQSAFPVSARESHEQPTGRIGTSPPDEWPRTARAHAIAYQSGESTPEQVAERAFREARKLAARSPSLGPLLAETREGALAAARESEERIASGNARSALEGVPIAIKEEVDVAGLPTRMGTAWRPATPVESDCVAVTRLRTAGAVILGNTPMTEYGLSPLGGNVHRSMPRNPHDPSRLAGGSSTGSAVAVATGVVPVALGCDGGGSIRVPAALNGVFGLKPTYGRIPTTGHGLPAGSTVVHVGPIGASTHDLAAFTQIAAGPDAADPASRQQPPLTANELFEALRGGAHGLRIGVDAAEWADAQNDVAAPARAALEALEREGAELVDVTIGLAKYAPALGFITIGLEMLCALSEARDRLSELGPDVQLLLAGLARFGADEYLDAQRLRATLRAQVAEVLTQVDLLALPTTTRAAPPVTDKESRVGFVDSAALYAMCRYAFLANLTGLPAASAPVGVSSEGLPVGLQLIGDAWDEATVLRALAHLEHLGTARVIRPPAAVDVFAE